jgi:hypothetical protein
MCLPMARALPTGLSGDFGTSPFLGQLTDKMLLGRTRRHGEPDVKNNRGREINSRRAIDGSACALDSWLE